MGEIMRWRLTRAPQKRIPLDGSVVVLEPPATGATASPALPSGSAPAPGTPAAPGQLHPLLASAANAGSGLLALERWLTARDNRPAPNDLRSEITTLLGQFLPASGQWVTLRNAVTQALYQFLIAQASSGNAADQAQGEGLVRLRLVIALVDTLQAQPGAFGSPDQVEAALRWRILQLPDAIAARLEELRQKNRPALVRRPGFADLFITREEWNRYEAGEIASIENVLGRETKSRVHLLVNETSQTTTVEQASSKTTEQDNTTTDNTQLQQQSSSDISIAAHVDAQVDVSGQYGPTQIQAHAGGSLDFSASASNQRASTQSHETVARALTRIVQSTREVRTTSTRTRSKDRELHKLDNSQGADPVVGIYRWVDQIQRVELDRYPHRFLMEFELPEPGAFTRWLHRNDTARRLVNQPPVPFTQDGTPNGPPITPDAIDPTNLPGWLARYRAAGGRPSPPGIQAVAANVTIPETSGSGSIDRKPLGFKSDTSIAVPNGYYAVSWQASVLANGIGDTSDHNKFESPVAVVHVSVGSGPPQKLEANDVNAGIAATMSGDVGGISQGDIPIAVEGESFDGLSVNVVVTCQQLGTLLPQWQLESFDLLAGAYNNLLAAYNDELAQLSVDQRNVVDESSPAQNQRTILDELKRQVIEMLTGKTFTGRPAIQWDDTGVVAPSTNLGEAVKVSPEIQFLEQAFEWETLSYVLYPYYWAAAARWPDLSAIQGNDEEFARFLRAGSARVVLPARPGFEDQVNFYLKYGIIWGGGPVPAPGDPDYLSIADEIRAQQQRPRDVTVIDAWELRLPTTLVWLENPAGLPANPSPTITLPP